MQHYFSVFVSHLISINKIFSETNVAMSTFVIVD
jgi:hypothetical protein